MIEVLWKQWLDPGIGREYRPIRCVVLRSPRPTPLGERRIEVIGVPRFRPTGGTEPLLGDVAPHSASGRVIFTLQNTSSSAGAIRSQEACLVSNVAFALASTGWSMVTRATSAVGSFDTARSAERHRRVGRTRSPQTERTELRRERDARKCPA